MRTRVVRRFDSDNAVYIYEAQRFADVAEVRRREEFRNPYLKNEHLDLITEGEWIGRRKFPNREDADSFAARLADGLSGYEDEVVSEFGTGEQG